MGLKESVGELGNAVLAVLGTRLELFSIEVSEQKESIIKLLCLAFGALVCLALSLLILTLTLALFFWHTEYRYIALGVAVLLYAVLGLLMLRAAWKVLRGPMPFEASIAELRRDIESLGRLGGNDDPSTEVRRGGPDHV